MLSALVRFSIRCSGIVLVLSLLLLIYGGYRFSNAGLDIFPEFSPKQVIIQTESPGLSAEQVEVLVTQQIEMSLGGLIGLHSLRSESIQGLSIVTAIFDDNSDIYRNRQLVSERLAGLTDTLPPAVAVPVPLPLSSASATVLTIGLSSDAKDLMELRSLVDWSIVPRLLSVPGIADVNVFGGKVKQLQIQLAPNRLRRFNLAIDDIIEAASQAGQVRGVGFLENSNQRFSVQINSLTNSPEQLNKIVVKHVNGKNITLGDVTDILYAPEPPIGAAQIMGKPAIVIMLIAQYGANTLTVTKALERSLAEFDALFSRQEINFYPRLFRPADYIETSLVNLSGHLILGGVFVILILYVFLFNFRSAFISAIAIPLSLISAVLILLESGINLNIMVLGGLAIALGEVVDDAIIDTENIYRRLRENRELPQPQPISEVVYQASLEVRGSVVYASFIVALVFVPLLTLSGVAGRLFAPLGLSYILAILMSLLVALTITPALCYLLLGKGHNEVTDPPLIKCLNPLYRSLLKKVNRCFKPLVYCSILIFLLSLFAATNLEKKFLPELREGHYIVHTSSIPGTSLQESIRIGSRLSEQFMQIPGVDSVSQWSGRAERGADTYGSHYSEYEVRLRPMPGKQQQAVLQRLREILSAFPGILFEANTFLTERIDETISGYSSPVVVNIYGNDLALLDGKAREIAAIMHSIPGATDVQLRSPPASPLLQVALNPDQLAFWGLRPKQVLNALQTAYETQTVGNTVEDNRIFKIAVTLQPELRNKPESIAEIPLKTPSGQIITLAQVADIHYAQTRYNILHQGAQRHQTVTCNVNGRDLDGFMRELKTKVQTQVFFSHNSYPEFTGAAIEQAQARHELILHSLLAGSGVLIFIYIAIGSLRNMLLTLLNLPFSLVGGIIAVLITDASLSVGSVVGFVTLFGITVRNSIMLVSHYRQLVEIEHLTWNLETAIQGAQERLPSILMTALVTALAMFPIAFDSDNPGREIMGPMASIIIGGLASSTLLNLLLLPSMLLKFGEFNRTV